LVAEEFILEMNQVNAGYGEIEVLMDISIQVKPGQIVSFLGANGAGKSTLLKTLFGEVKPTRGQVLFFGDDITRNPSIERLRLGMAYVPEGRSNFPGMTVQENLEMGAYIRRDVRHVKEEADELVHHFPILNEKRNVAAGNLSGGQQQILEIAIALMLKPKVLLIDEPTLGLAPILVTEVFKELQKINRGGTTIVLVEQNAKRALEISDYAYVLELGRIRFEGPADHLAQNDEVIEAYLGER
jgi:branched-chain amino acid transport system ATP-binding protein